MNNRNRRRGSRRTACVYAMALRGSAREIVLGNRDRERARGAVADLQYGAVLARPVSLSSRRGGDRYHGRCQRRDRRAWHLAGIPVVDGARGRRSR